MSGVHTSCNKRVSYAWARYYESTRQRHQSDHTNFGRLKTTITALPEHIRAEYLVMMEELKKTWECPCCLEMISPNNLDITNCGHFFCKGCLTTLKTTSGDDCKCPICRRKIGTP